ncbi:uncharacterized protein C2845_PM11G07280 [Panicum miliaceum]|uniref:Myb/SANT-like DNA-binding domain-containing protein n=1 Tax=Panicum miliaceum TaxID=4540 RepID=A0A3L6RUN1_PANMI|nr:uncharacterized protein C2845_PM11G07280 [Panicum miliaceum]
MEGNLPPRALIPGGAPFDLGQPFHFADQPQVVQVHQGAFAAPAANQMQGFASAVKPSLSSEEDADDGHHGRGKAAAPASQWHRVKWTSDMVKLLVSAVAYIDEDIDADHGTSSGRKKHAMLKRKGKWRLVSSVMTERGFSVSPQQCEDKFNDLNKRYRRLTEILGRGTACQIVEKPALLEQVSLSAKLKEEAKKHLSSKHLHYEEMCSYHNHNRHCLLDDPALQRSLHMALRSPGEQGKKCSFGYDDEDDQMFLSDEDDEDDGFNDDLEFSAEDHRHHRVHGSKKLKHDHEGGCCGSHLSEVAAIDMNQMFSEGTGGSAQKNPSVEMVQLHWFSVLAVAGEMSLKSVMSSVCYHIEVEAMHFLGKNCLFSEEDTFQHHNHGGKWSSRIRLRQTGCFLIQNSRYRNHDCVRKH